MIVHINGMSGVGKFTVAKILANKISAHLIDNHLLIDLTTSICDRGSDAYFTILEKLLDIVLEQIAEKPSEIYIFTNSLSAELKEDRVRLDKIRSFADIQNIIFIQVLLSCNLEENKKRIISDDRKIKGKLTNAVELDNLYNEYTIYHPKGVLTLEIDTTNLSAENTANEINTFIQSYSTF